MTDKELNDNRMVVIGRVEEANDKQVKIRYDAATGPVVASVPREAIVQQVKTHDRQTAFLIQETELQHGTYDPIKRFGGAKSPFINESEHIELADALEQGINKSNLNFLVKEQKSETVEKPSLFGSSDDSVPDFGEGVLELSELIEGSEDPWDGGLLAGGRSDLLAHDWRFEPAMLPLFVAIGDGDGTMAPTFAPCNNKKGNIEAYGVFNPTYASDERPAGALLSTVSKDFHPQAYAPVFDPILALASENDWKAKVYAYKEGAKARLDADVSQATQSRKEASKRLRENGHPWLSTNLMDTHAQSLDGLYRYGFSVLNSLDRSSALKVQMVAERVYCTNLAVMGSATTLASMRHNSTMKDSDWDSFAGKIDLVLTEAQRQLIDMEFLQHIPVDVQLYERLMTLCERNGLISWPKIAPQETGPDKVTGGHMWRLMGDGWTKPKNDWINVSKDQAGTLYHVYNILNGAITHKPEWTDGKTTTLKGRVIGLDTLDARLKTVHNTITGVATQSIEDYRKDAGVDKIGTKDLSDMKAYVNEEGLSAINDIPMASEILGF
tara:strand:- start:26413 stop:28071 length:1659 start_codon:yes stop_codon:yes gene_type:complete